MGVAIAPLVVNRSSEHVQSESVPQGEKPSRKPVMKTVGPSGLTVTQAAVTPGLMLVAPRVEKSLESKRNSRAEVMITEDAHAELEEEFDTRKVSLREFFSVFTNIDAFERAIGG